MSVAPPPSVSAIVVTYNGSRWLPRLFESLLPELAPYSAQVLLVDNGSNDGSGAYVRTHHPTVTVVTIDENRGPIPAINRGLAEAHGEWIFVLNDDLEFQPGAVATMLTEAQNQPLVGLAAPLLLDQNGAVAASYGWEINEWIVLQMILSVHRRRMARADWGKLPAVGRWRAPYLQGACLLVRKSALDDVGPMDEQFHMFFDDVDWSRRFRQAGWRIALLNRARVVHFGSATAGVPQEMPLRRAHHGHASMDYFARKHYGQPRSFILRLLYALVFAKAMVSLWLRSRLPRAIPGAIINLDHDGYSHTLAFYRSIIRDVLRARGGSGGA